MKTRIFLILLWILAGWGCYEDKGNYDYTEINELEFSITPADNKGIYVYRQPATDTLRVTYNVVVSQSMKEKEDNLSFRWIATGGGIHDTTNNRELTLFFPPKVSREYKVLFQVKDEENNISYYKEYLMKTQLPFMRSWLVLHGEAGDRRIAAIENPDSTESLITYDAYEEMHGRRRFKNAEHLIYSAKNDANQYDITTYEQLIVTGPDSVDYLYPYDFVVHKNYEDLIPNLDAPKIIGGYAINTAAYVWLMDENHKLYHSGGEGNFFTLRTEPAVDNYKADKLYISANAYTTIWDETNRKLMYYFNGANYYSSSSMSNNSLLSPISFRTTISLADGSTQDREVLWIGKRVNTGEGREGATILVKDTVFTFHQINYNVKNEKYKLDSLVVKQMDINANTSFASSLAFVNQVFYSTGTSVYVLNLLSGEQKLLYNAGGGITQLQFRAVNALDASLDKDDNFKLAVVVDKGGSGELHELYLGQAGDIKSVNIHTGFGPIQDICYSLILWNMFDEV